MTTIITRVFPDAAAAHNAAERLIFKGIPSRSCEVIVESGNLEGAMVHESAIAPYGKLLAAGNAVLVVRATYKPLGAARLVRTVLDEQDTINTGRAVNEHSPAWKPERAASVMKDHPHFLTYPGMGPKGRISDMFGLPMLKAHKAKKPLMAHDKRMSRMFWPMKLVSKKNRSSSVMRGGRQMSKLFWPMKLISSGERQNSVIPGGGFPFSRRIGMKTIS